MAAITVIYSLNKMSQSLQVLAYCYRRSTLPAASFIMSPTTASHPSKATLNFPSPHYFPAPNQNRPPEHHQTQSPARRSSFAPIASSPRVSSPSQPANSKATPLIRYYPRTAYASYDIRCPFISSTATYRVRLGRLARTLGCFRNG